MQNGKTIVIELSSRFPNGEYYNAVLELPADDSEILEAERESRINDDESEGDISIVAAVCPAALEHMVLDSMRIDELNYYAKRLASLTDEQRPVYQALVNRYIKNLSPYDLVSIKDLINMTFNLDTVPVASNISNPAELGQFVIDHSLNPLLESIPDEVIPLIDRAKLGELQVMNDRGEFVDGIYVPTVHYECVEVYNGYILPDVKLEDVDPEILGHLGLTVEKTTSDDAEQAVRCAAGGCASFSPFRSVRHSTPCTC